MAQSRSNREAEKIPLSRGTIQVELLGSLSVNERLDIKTERGAHAGRIFPIDLLQDCRLTSIVQSSGRLLSGENKISEKYRRHTGKGFSSPFLSACFCE